MLSRRVPLQKVSYRSPIATGQELSMVQEGCASISWRSAGVSVVAHATNESMSAQYRISTGELKM
jgi:hypothetical protein